MNSELLRENRIHGEPMYPVSLYEVHETERLTMFDCHWHDEVEFVLVTEGRVIVQIDTTDHELTAGQAIFIAGGVIHAAYKQDDRPASLYAVVFHPGFLSSRTYDTLQQKYLDPILTGSLQLPPQIVGNSKDEQHILKLLQELVTVHRHRPPAYELTTKAALYRIFSLLYSHASSSPTPTVPSAQPHKMERLKQALTYIHEHYGESIKLKELADTVNMSEEHFCRFFKQLVKKSPVEYVNYYRMQKAALLLESTDKKILEVALLVGFEHLSYFITVFKSYSGVTPSQYRKRHFQALDAAPK